MSDARANNKIVIIGGVAIGAGAAAKARRMDESAEIIVVERGPYVSFANCGLPYYLGGVIKERGKLLLHTPQSLKTRFNIDARVQQELVSIDRVKKTVRIHDLGTDREYDESYDKLILATGAKPIVPAVPGADSDGVFTLRDIPDVDEIQEWISSHDVRHAVVIGAGFIGLETAENLVHRGIQVTLVDKANQIMTPFDAEMTTPAVKELQRLGVNVLLGDGFTEFQNTDGVQAVVLESGRRVAADLFIMGLGVRPDTSVAKDAGLAIGSTGALMVNDYLQTSDPDIYSGGDLAEIIERVTGEHRWIPLAGAANKQARIIGTNVCGGAERFTGAQGTSIVRIGDVALAMTGISEKLAKRMGIDHFVSYTTSGHHAGFYPGAQDLTVKLMVHRPSGRVLGAEIVGQEGVDKRIDVIATAIAAKMTVEDLESLDLAYAPPFSSAKDPVIMAGMVADNVLRGEIQMVHEIKDVPDERVQILDVRRDDEVVNGRIDSSVHIPLDELRNRVGELNPSIPWIVYCRSGQRSYNACRILKGFGFAQVYNLSGGYLVYEMKQAAHTPH